MDKLRKLSAKRGIFTVFLLISLVLTMVISSKGMTEEDGQDFLSKEQAFSLSAQLKNDHQIELHFTITPGYHLYREHFKFRTLEGLPLNNLAKLFPRPITKRDEVLGDYQVYSKDLLLLIPLDPKRTSHPGIRVEYQGCSESGFCYPPINKEIIVLPRNILKITEITPQQFNQKNPDAPSSVSENQVKSSPPSINIEERLHSNNEVLANTPKTHPIIQSETDTISAQLKTGAVPMTLLVFLGLGILLAFTPCVLPMVPILANILVGDKVPLSSRRATLLASLYVFSLALCYAVAGALAGLMGNQFQLALQKPAFIIGLSFILLLFALNQFSLLHIQMPQIFGQTLHQFQYKQKQGSILGAITMGGISALMVSPCVTPALVGALTYIGQTGNALLGGLALFAMAIGMGLPLIVVACIGSHLLPRAGKWMVHLKTITGIFLLILAAFILMRAFPNIGQAKAIKELAHFTTVQTVADFDTAIANARVANKPIILDVYADWCVSCQLIDKEIFENHSVLNTLQETTLLRFDMTELSHDKETLRKMLNIIGPPTLLFFSPAGQELKNYRLVGKQEFIPFIKHVKQFLATEKEGKLTTKQ